LTSDTQRDELNTGKYTPEEDWEKGSRLCASSMMLHVHTDGLSNEQHQASHTPTTQLQKLTARCFRGKEQKEHLKPLIGKRDVMEHSK